MHKTTSLLFFFIFNYLFCANAINAQDIQFIKFINYFKVLASHQGISENTLNVAFDGITQPYPNIIKSVKNQPEFNQDAQSYLNDRVTVARIDEGKKQKVDLQNYLNIIEKKYGVDRNIVLAIWANETNYGKALKNPKVMKDAVKALTSLAYYKSRYNKYAKKQLIALLKILQKDYMNRADLKSSWAGAMGQTQFIPTSYLIYAQDIDSNGEYNINKIPDALATTANLLAQNGWQRNRAWIYELNSSEALKLKHLSDVTYTLNHWRALGLRLKNGKELPASNQRAKLIKLSGAMPCYLLVLHNFKVIKAYNNSDLYALSVGLLANALKN